MKTIHLKLHKGTNTIRLQQLSLDTTYNTSIKISSCFIAWSLQNVRTDVNNTFEKKGVAVTIPQGYYTFSDLKTLLKTHNITMEKTQASHITVESDEDLDLQSFGPLLGFVVDKTISKNTKTTSEAVARFINGLKTIHIHCPSLVDYDSVYSGDSLGLYFRSSLLATLHVDTTTSLNGTFSHYNLDNVRLPCRDFVGADLTFIVECQGHVDDYEIYLVLELE